MFLTIEGNKKNNQPTIPIPKSEYPVERKNWETSLFTGIEIPAIKRNKIPPAINNPRMLFGLYNILNTSIIYFTD